MNSVPLTAHVGAASINQTVGDWVGNARRVRAVIAAARERGVRLLVLPEMCLPGYSLGDRLLMRGTVDRSWTMLEELAPDCAGMVVCLGLPVRHRDVLYNAVAVVADGQIVGVVPKENLATGDVQYENRWFSGWVRGRTEVFTSRRREEIPFGSLLFVAPGLGKFAVEVCEDGWKGNRPGSMYALAGAQVVVNPSASWFTVGKHRVRRAMVEQISREDHLVYLYSSLLGCDATRLVFDGSVFIAQDGELLEEGRRFLFKEEFELVSRVVDLARLQRARSEEGSWREQVASFQRGDFGQRPPLVEISGDFSTPLVAPAVGPYWRVPPEPPSDPSLQWLVDAGLVPEIRRRDVAPLELELALALGLREYVTKCGIGGVVIALSGGRDSSMCALLAHRMHRYDNPDLSDSDLKVRVGERLVTAYMATDNSSEHTRSAAEGLARELGARHYQGDIQSTVDLHVEVMNQLTGVQLTWDDPQFDIPLQNVQARLRGSLIWLVANVHQFLLITTSNKSEAAVGYATMDGDTSGGLSLIADVPKSLITDWLAWASAFHGYTSVASVLSMPATAELRPGDDNQTDEGDLMPYEVLDQLMYHFVQLGQEPVELFRSLWPEMQDRYAYPREFAGHIKKFVRLFCRAQWKRERFAISFRVTAFDLDPKTGFRFPPVHAPFDVELDELDAHVAGL